MNNFDVYSKDLDNHITFFEKHYAYSENDKQELKTVQYDINYKLDKILENSHKMTNDEIIQLLVKITRINTLIAMIK